MEYTGYLDFWFTDRPMARRVAAFAALGITRTNVFAWRQAPLREIVAACRDHGATLYSTFDGDMGSLADPGDNEKTLRSWAESLEMAVTHDVAVLYIFSNQIERRGDREVVRRLSGNYDEGAQYANLLRQTERIMQLVEQTDVEVRVECLNRHDFIGRILVDNPYLAADWVRRLDHPQLRLTFDTYHQQRGSGELLSTLTAHAAWITAVHLGDVPTRQEPGTGEINFVNIRRRLRELNFDGEIGLEFTPSTDPVTVMQRVRDIFPLA